MGEIPYFEVKKPAFWGRAIFEGLSKSHTPPRPWQVLELVAFKAVRSFTRHRVHLDFSSLSIQHRNFKGSPSGPCKEGGPGFGEMTEKRESILFNSPADSGLPPAQE
jgi:hypothetical protein